MEQQVSLPKEARAEIDDVIAFASRYGNVEISSAEGYASANEALSEVSARIKKITDLRLSITRPMDNAKKTVMDLFAVPLNRLSETKENLKNGMLTFSRKMEQERIQAEAAAREAARKEQERLEREAAKAEKAGKIEQAEAKRTLAEQIPSVPTVAAPLPKVKGGASVRKTYKAEVVDLLALVKAVAAGKAPMKCLEANMGFLNAQATALKDEFAYPGCKVAVHESMTTGRGVRSSDPF